MNVCVEGVGRGGGGVGTYICTYSPWRGCGMCQFRSLLDVLNTAINLKQQVHSITRGDVGRQDDDLYAHTDACYISITYSFN